MAEVCVASACPHAWLGKGYPVCPEIGRGEEAASVSRGPPSKGLWPKRSRVAKSTGPVHLLPFNTCEKNEKRKEDPNPLSQDWGLGGMLGRTGKLWRSHNVLL